MCTFASDVVVGNVVKMYPVVADAKVEDAHGGSYPYHGSGEAQLSYCGLAR